MQSLFLNTVSYNKMKAIFDTSFQHGFGKNTISINLEIFWIQTQDLPGKIGGHVADEGNGSS